MDDNRPRASQCLQSVSSLHSRCSLMLGTPGASGAGRIYWKENLSLQTHGCLTSFKCHLYMHQGLRCLLPIDIKEGSISNFFASKTSLPNKFLAPNLFFTCPFGRIRHSTCWNTEFTCPGQALMSSPGRCYPLKLFTCYCFLTNRKMQSTLSAPLSCTMQRVSF